MREEFRFKGFKTMTWMLDLAQTVLMHTEMLKIAIFLEPWSLLQNGLLSLVWNFQQLIECSSH